MQRRAKHLGNGKLEQKSQFWRKTMTACAFRLSCRKPRSIDRRSSTWLPRGQILQDAIDYAATVAGPNVGETNGAGIDRDPFVLGCTGGKRDAA